MVDRFDQYSPVIPTAIEITRRIVMKFFIRILVNVKTERFETTITSYLYVRRILSVLSLSLPPVDAKVGTKKYFSLFFLFVGKPSKKKHPKQLQPIAVLSLSSINTSLKLRKLSTNHNSDAAKQFVTKTFQSIFSLDD